MLLINYPLLHFFSNIILPKLFSCLIFISLFFDISNTDKNVTIINGLSNLSNNSVKLIFFLVSNIFLIPFILSSTLNSFFVILVLIGFFNFSRFKNISNAFIKSSNVILLSNGISFLYSSKLDGNLVYTSCLFNSKSLNLVVISLIRSYSER